MKRYCRNPKDHPLHRYAVIIPTTCAAERASLLHRAIASIDTRQTELVVVANGSRVDERLLDQLRAYRASVYRLEVGNVSVARKLGVASSTAPFFSFLDDDDELLEGALEQRASLFQPALACVVTNGYLRTGGVDSPLVPDSIALHINADPVGTFLQHNWFASPASMFRRTGLPEALLDTSLHFFEWTQLFFRMAEKGIGIRWDDALTYRKYEDHPFSVSKSMAYAKAYPAFLRDEILPMKLRPQARRALRRKLATALNTLSQEELRAGDRRAAWTAHFKCLKAGGWHYLPYTRKLLS